MELKDMIEALQKIEAEFEKDGYPNEGVEVIIECDHGQAPEFVGHIGHTHYAIEDDELVTVHPDDVGYYDENTVKVGVIIQ